MAIVVITSSQPSTYARIGDAYLTSIKEGVSALRSGLARAAEMRHHAPHGLAMCSVLFVIMALVTRGDAAIDGHFVHVRGKTETQAIFTSVMQSMPTMAASGARTMWLGDTVAGMHCVTNVSLA
eukprot:6209959-Pleurochrysis_carterae.AAC.1